ncbi:hypothetical protein J437_LFUL002368 [Ladona fulva]|uniref:Thyroglobulin type-1 domain-containing protein n=1 Tax=Ladona fulva TaxID=123851 RepID=A0A8K0P1A5_LADFU|nr:hypothetical protein J437_LFUL002368 [Ladona fulva]
MVDLSGGPDGPIEHGFSNTVFIGPAIIIISLVRGEGRVIGGEKYLIRNSYVAELLMMCLSTSFEKVKMSEADVMRDMLQGMGALGKEVGMSEEDSEKAGNILEQLINGYKELEDEEKDAFIKNIQKTFQGKVQEAFTSHMTNAFYTKAGLLLACFGKEEMIKIKRKLSVIFLTLSWLFVETQEDSAISSDIPLCTNKVCSDYIDENGCPDVSNCSGIVLPSPSVCNCCKYCLNYIEEGGQCSPGVPGQASIQMICGARLTCRDNVCVKMKTPCMEKKGKYDELWQSGQLWGSEIDPNCDDHGDYGPVQCIPGSICYCSSPTGERIFGEMVYKHGDMTSRMDCACSRAEWRARNRIKSIEEQASRQLQMASIFARCTPSGSYDILQCVKTRCACVDKEGVPQPPDYGKKVDYTYLSNMKDGKPWCFNLTKYKPGSFETPCLRERGKFIDIMHQLEGGGKIEAIVLGEEFVIPSCDPDGSFQRVQRSWERDFSDLVCSVYCVDPEGNLLGDADGAYSLPHNTLAASEMDCNCARTVYLLKEWGLEESGGQTTEVPPVIVRMPVCCRNGNFAKWQCHHAECHCVDNNGAQIGINVPIEKVSTLICYIKNNGERCTPTAQ